MREVSHTSTSQTSFAYGIGGEVFQKNARLWWDEKGPFAALHHIVPVHMKAVIRASKWLGQDADAGLSKYQILDVGCGGGLLAEPMARLGGHIKGIDGEKYNISVARDHAAQMDLRIDYEHVWLNAYQQHKRAVYDIVTAFEVVEHTRHPLQFLADVAHVLKPGGMLVLSTLHRSLISYMAGILIAEGVGWVPPGTHDWEAFLTPAELSLCGRLVGFTVEEVESVTYNPLKRGATSQRISAEASCASTVNYTAIMRKHTVR